jgi:ABC-type multidrug transport system permease subunit
LKTKLRQALYIGLFDSLPLLRDPMLLLLISLLSFLPVLFIFVFAGNSGAALQSIAGAIVLILAFTGLNAAQSVYFNKHWFRFQDMFVASGVSLTTYALGLSIGALVVSTPAIAFSFALLLLGTFPGLLQIGISLGAILLLWVAMIFIGFSLGTSTKNVRRANSTPQILGIALGFLPPVYYPLSRLPGYLQPLAILVPTTDAAQLVKYYFGLLPLSALDIQISWIYLAAFAVVAAVVAVRRANWVDP